MQAILIVCGLLLGVALMVAGGIAWMDASARRSEDASQREKQIADLVKFLRASGTRILVLVGPAPDWPPDLRGMFVRAQLPNDFLPDYLPRRAGPGAPHWRVTPIVPNLLVSWVLGIYRSLGISAARGNAESGF